MNGDKASVSGVLILMLTALIWGIAFVAQSVGMDYVGPLTFNFVRFYIGGLVLIPSIFFLRKISGNPEKLISSGERRQRRHDGIIGGICCGFCLGISSIFQQIGIMGTSVGKAGFITALYIVIVPILGILIGRKTSPKIWVGVFIALFGMYLLCIKDGFGLSKGDFFVFLCAIGFSFHILVIDYFTPKADGTFISCIQFFTAAILCTVLAFIFERPELQSILNAWIPILYAGVLSCGVAYTLQIIGQKKVAPALASMILSLESAFSLLAGWIILGERLSIRELVGCALVFAAIIIAQL